jgi:hypothetical protein
MTPKYLDRDWTYHGVASHNDASRFRRRMKAYARDIVDQAEAQKAAAVEADRKVRPISKRASA